MQFLILKCRYVLVLLSGQLFVQQMLSLLPKRPRQGVLRFFNMRDYIGSHETAVFLEAGFQESIFSFQLMDTRLVFGVELPGYICFQPLDAGKQSLVSFLFRMNRSQIVVEFPIQKRSYLFRPRLLAHIH